MIFFSERKNYTEVDFRDDFGIAIKLHMIIEKEKYNVIFVMPFVSIGACGIMAIVVGNRRSYTSSNPHKLCSIIALVSHPARVEWLAFMVYRRRKWTRQ